MVNYECHITMESNGLLSPAGIKDVVETSGWSFSQIDGDPQLGKGVKCYATNHFNFSEAGVEAVQQSIVLNELDTYVDLYKSRGAKVIRKKIEKIVYDVQINDETKQANIQGDNQ